MERLNTIMGFITKMEKGKKKNGYDKTYGEKVWGLIRKEHPNLLIWNSLDECKGIVAKRGYKPTEEEIEGIYEEYQRKYYDKMYLSRFHDASLALQLMDLAVTDGISVAMVQLQGVLHIPTTCNVNEKTIITANNKKGVLEAFVDARKRYYNVRYRNSPKVKDALIKRVDEGLAWYKEADE